AISRCYRRLAIKLLGSPAPDIQRAVTRPGGHDLIDHLGKNELHPPSLETGNIRELQLTGMDMHASILCAASQGRDHFLRIQQAVRIKSPLECQEEIQLLPGELNTHLIDLLDADPVFTGDRTPYFHT